MTVVRRLAPVLAACALVIASCATTPAGPGKDPLAGHYTGAGSGAAIETLRALSIRYGELHPGVDFGLEDVGAETGIVLVTLGQADFGFISRELYAEEAGKVVLTTMTGTGTAIAVNAANPVTGLTKDQVRRIFAGEITDWGAVGGTPGAAIKVFIREATSSTRASFESYFFGGKATYTKAAIEVVESKATYDAIRSFKDGIAMVTLQVSTQTDKTMRLLSLDGVAATTATVSSGAYPIRRPVYLISNVDRSKLKPAVVSFIAFIKSDEGQAILSKF